MIESTSLGSLVTIKELYHNRKDSALLRARVCCHEICCEEVKTQKLKFEIVRPPNIASLDIFAFSVGFRSSPLNF